MVVQRQNAARVLHNINNKVEGGEAEAVLF